MVLLCWLRPTSTRFNTVVALGFHFIIIIITIIKAFKTLRHKTLFTDLFIHLLLFFLVSMWRLCFSPSLAPIQSVSLWHGTIYTSEICWVCIALLADSPDETITPSFFPRAKNFFIFALSNFSCNICALDEWMSSPCLFERKWYKSNKIVKQVEDNVRNIWLIIYWSNHKIQKQDFFHFPQTSLLICRHKKKI